MSSGSLHPSPTIAPPAPALGQTRDRRLFASARARWALGSTFAVLAANWAVAVARFQVNVLYWDQWGFFTPVMEGGGWWRVFDRQHGPHRQGLAFLVTTWIMGLCHWDERVDSLWIAGVLLAAGVLALLLKRRMAGPLTTGDAWILLAMLTLSQCESVIITPNASHSVFPLLLTLGLCHLWLSAVRAWHFAAIGAGIGCLAFTGFGLFSGMVATAALGAHAVIAVRQGRRRLATNLAWALPIAGGAWIAFFFHYRFDPAAPGFRFPWQPPIDYLRFALLMFSAPTGWQEASELHYAVGLGVLGLVALATGGAFRRWRRRPSLAAPPAVILLLALGSLLYCANTAVGRVQFGPAAGLASRYITLMLPAWLAVYLWSAEVASPFRGAVRSALWLLVLLPYLPILGRPLAQWPGSLGAPSATLARLRSISDQKLAFVVGYEATHDARVVADTYDALVAPREMLDYIGERLAFQERQGLTFFADRGVGYAPWLSRDLAIWRNAYPAESGFRWLGRSAELLVRNRADQYLNLATTGGAAGLRPDAQLEIQVDGDRALLDRPQAEAGLSVRLPAGAHAIAFASPAGTVRAGDGDTRQISFALSEPTLSPAPRYPVWSAAAGTHSLRAAYQLTVLSGFNGWEDRGAFGWTTRQLALSVSASVPVYLNVQVDGRAPRLAPGPIRLHLGRDRIDIAAPGGRASFSVPIPAGATDYPVAIENATGDVQPSLGSASTDDRHLALSLRHLSLDPAPLYEPLRL